MFEADLHVHTAHSPCAEAEMTPLSIVEEAVRLGLDIIAICDHNRASNTAPAIEAAGSALAVIAGMEITTAEEVHVLGFFPSAEVANEAAEEVGRTLPRATPEGTGTEGAQTRRPGSTRAAADDGWLFGAASGLDLERVVGLVKRHGGLAVAAHVDRPSYSVFSQLGFFPEQCAFDAIEISAANATPPWAARIGELRLPVVRGSDAHFLSELGACRTRLRMLAPTFEELARALAGDGGRGVL